MNSQQWAKITAKQYSENDNQLLNSLKVIKSQPTFGFL